MLPSALLSALENVQGFNREAFEAVHASGQQITSIRFNPDKQSLVKQEDTVDSRPSTTVPWCPYGYYLAERPSFTFDPLFHAGAYYVQEASSMFLWQVLTQLIPSAQQKKVLDLCAAPGGKSTLLASYFKEGLVVANEVIKSRANILIENITKWGSDHVVVTNNDPSHFQSLKNYFDVMVIDAPCSGSGLFRKDPDAINEWSEENVKLCSLRQQRIIADVLPALKENGILIYSTCSYSPEEDERILDWIMNEFNVSECRLQVPGEWNIVETQSNRHGAFGYRFYPDKLQGEGFFIAAFIKTASDDDAYFSEQNISAPSKQELQLLQSFYPVPDGYTVFKQNDSFRIIKKEWLNDLKILAKNLYIKKAGIEIGTIKGKDVIPSHELALSYLPLESMAAIELDKEQSLQYLKKKELNIAASGKGWSLVKYCGLSLGWIKVLPNRINNYYPGEWRILKD